MYIQLSHRHFGVHKPIKHTEIPCEFKDIVLGDDHINEELLLKHIPENWLSDKPEKILVTVEDKYGGTGQCGLEHFRNWSKYYDAYVLNLIEEPLDWWKGENNGV